MGGVDSPNGEIGHPRQPGFGERLSMSDPLVEVDTSVSMADAVGARAAFEEAHTPDTRTAEQREAELRQTELAQMLTRIDQSGGLRSLALGEVSQELADLIKAATTDTFDGYEWTLQFVRARLQVARWPLNRSGAAPATGADSETPNGQPAVGRASPVYIGRATVDATTEVTNSSGPRHGSNNVASHGRPRNSSMRHVIDWAGGEAT